MVVGAVLMRSTDRSRVRTGSVLVLIFTLVGLLITAGGLIVGFILGMAGSIMGLVWKPHEKPTPTVPALPRFPTRLRLWRAPRARREGSPSQSQCSRDQTGRV